MVKIAARSASDEHLPVWEQGRNMSIARGGKATGDRPRPGRWIVKFRACESAAVVATGDEHLAIVEQRCGVQIAGAGEASGLLKLGTRAWLRQQYSKAEKK
jgi:hypothetical protein